MKMVDKKSFLLFLFVNLLAVEFFALALLAGIGLRNIVSS